MDSFELQVIASSDYNQVKILDGNLLEENDKHDLEHMVVKLIPRLISVPDSKRKSSEAKSDTIFKLKNLKVPKSDLWEDLFSVPTVDSFITGFDYDPIFDFMM